MGWLNPVVREARASKTTGTVPSNPSQWLVDLLGGPDSATGIKVTEENALTANAVWSCVRILSETIAALPLHVYRTRPDGGKEKAPGYPLYELLHDQPNPEMTTMEWREAAIGHLALWGNSYSEIERDNAFRPVAIWPLRPDKMFVWRNTETRQLEYIYQLWQGGTVYFAPDEILHVRSLSRDGILGLSPIGMQREAIGMGLALERYGGALFGNGANPGGLISVPGILTEAAKTNLKNSWEVQHRGPGNAGRTAVLEQGVTWQATGLPPEDAQFILSRQFSLLEVARIFRMPPHKLQDLTRATFSNIEQNSLDFVTDTLLPYLVRFEQAARRSLVPESDRASYFVKHAVDALLRGDIASRYAAYSVGRQWGWLSADDVREKEDMNPLPDGDGQDYLVPLNMVPVGEAPLEPTAATPVTEPDAAAVNGVDAQSARMLYAFLEDIGRRLVAREDADICRAARKWLGRRQPEEFRRWLGGFIETHRGFIAQQVLPPFRLLDEEFAEEMADEFAERHLRELGRLLVDFENADELERRLAVWRAERPAQMAQKEARRALRGLQMAENPAQMALSGLVSRLSEPQQAPEVRIENHQAPVTVQPAEVRIAEGAMRVDVAPPNLTIAEGAMRVDVQPPSSDVTIAEGAVKVEMAAPPVQIAEGAVQVDVQAPPAPEMSIQEGAVRVDVQPPNLTIAEGAVQVDVAPVPPADVTIAEGAVKVDVQPPPPAEVTIAEGAVQVDVAPVQAPQVVFQEGAVKVEAAKPPPAPRKPRLEAAKRKAADRKSKENPDG